MLSTLRSWLRGLLGNAEADDETSDGTASGDDPAGETGAGNARTAGDAGTADAGSAGAADRSPAARDATDAGTTDAETADATLTCSICGTEVPANEDACTLCGSSDLQAGEGATESHSTDEAVDAGSAVGATVDRRPAADTPANGSRARTDPAESDPSKDAGTDRTGAGGLDDSDRPDGPADSDGPDGPDDDRLSGSGSRTDRVADTPDADRLSEVRAEGELLVEHRDRWEPLPYEDGFRVHLPEGDREVGTRDEVRELLREAEFAE